MSGFTIEADVFENRLYMELRGSLDEDEAESAIEQVAEEVEKLSPGFDVVNDISEFKPLSQEVAETIAEGKAILAEHDPAAIVRVTGDSALGKMQFGRVGDDDGYTVETADSRDEAEEILADL